MFGISVLFGRSTLYQLSRFASRPPIRDVAAGCADQGRTVIARQPDQLPAQSRDRTWNWYRTPRVNVIDLEVAVVGVP
jgi:hypothetical protein